jgi:hypothetical protein
VSEWRAVAYLVAWLVVQRQCVCSVCECIYICAAATSIAALSLAIAQLTVLYRL